MILITFKSFSLVGFSTEQMVALCGGIFILPFFLFSSFAGQVADKYPKNKLIFYIKCWEIAVMILGSTGFITENIYLLFGSLFMMGLQSTFFGPVKYSILPDIVNQDELVQANALIEMGTFVAILFGTIIGGILISISLRGNIYVSLVVILFSIFGTLSSLKIKNIASTSPNLKIKTGIIRPTIEILKLGKRIKSVWLSILGISWFWFLGASLLSIFPIYVKNIINGNAQVVTLFLALFSIGVATGSLICEKLSKQRLELGLVPFGSIGISLFLVDIFLIGKPSIFLTNEVITIVDFLKNAISYRIIFDLLMLSICSGLFIIPLYTLIQQRSHPDERSRIIAANNIINALFMVIASIFLTIMYALNINTSQIFLILGILNTIVSIYIYKVIPEFLLRFYAMILSRMIYRLKIEGSLNIPKEGPAVLICNHVSFIDWLIISAGIKRPIRFVMHYSFIKIPILKIFFKDAKVIPIAGFKENPDVMQEAFEKISEELSNGELVCIFPEGQITATGNLNQYKSGIEKIIQRNPVPVVPMALHGLWGSFFSKKYGKAGSKPSIILHTIWSKIILEISQPLQVSSEIVTAKKLEDITSKMLTKN